ncbi:MAG: FecR domain-containing protein [Flavobacteriaceae bacterium]
MKQQYDDTFFARWLANELTAEELQGFKNSEDYQKYVQIEETLNTVEVQEFNIEENFAATLNKLSAEKENAKKRRVIPLWSYGIAASIAALIFVYGFFFQSETYTTQLAEKTNFELPDGSLVDLNSDSKISFKKYNWEKNRVLNLEGEAFFKVQKGSTFTVNTNQGNVSVLGTQFTVNSRENLYHITCFEGKVLVVTVQKDSIILTQGQSFRLQKGKSEEYSINEITPSWLHNETTFTEMPIKLVIEELERQFNITISGKENLTSELFTGRFSHENSKIAIQTVFIAMEIPYTTDTNGNVVIKNK